jgi:hypothetical protein
MTAEFVWMPVQRVNAVKTSDSQGDMAPLFAGTQITAGDYDEYRPAMSADASGRFFVSFDGTEDEAYTIRFLHIRRMEARHGLMVHTSRILQVQPNQMLILNQLGFMQPFHRLGTLTGKSGSLMQPS